MLAKSHDIDDAKSHLPKAALEKVPEVNAPLVRLFARETPHRRIYVCLRSVIEAARLHDVRTKTNLEEERSQYVVQFKSAGSYVLAVRLDLQGSAEHTTAPNYFLCRSYRCRCS